MRARGGGSAVVRAAAARLGSGYGAAGFGGRGGGGAVYKGKRWLGGGGTATALEESGSDSCLSQGGGARDYAWETAAAVVGPARLGLAQKINPRK